MNSSVVFSCNRVFKCFLFFFSFLSPLLWNVFTRVSLASRVLSDTSDSTLYRLFPLRSRRQVVIRSIFLSITAIRRVVAAKPRFNRLAEFDGGRTIDRILYNVAAPGETRRGCSIENTKIQGIKKNGKRRGRNWKVRGEKRGREAKRYRPRVFASFAIQPERERIQ